MPSQPIGFKISLSLPARTDTSFLGGATGAVGATGPLASSFFWAGYPTGITGLAGPTGSATGTVLLTSQSSTNSILFNLTSNSTLAVPTGAMFVGGTFNCTVPAASTGTLTVIDTTSNPAGGTATSSTYNSDVSNAHSLTFAFSTLKSYTAADTLTIRTTGISSINNGLIMIQKLQ